MEEINEETGAAEDAFLDTAAAEQELTQDQLKELLGKYITQLDEAQQNVLEAEAELKIRQGIRDNLQHTVIPELLDRAGISGIRLSDGRQLGIKEDLFVRIPTKDPEKQNICYTWMIEHGLGELIKQDVKLVESETTKITPELLDTLTRLGIYYETGKEVNTNSLKAAFRELTGLKAGSVQTVDPDTVPKEFGLYRVRTADIK